MIVKFRCSMFNVFLLLLYDHFDGYVNFFLDIAINMHIKLSKQI